MFSSSSSHSATKRTKLGQEIYSIKFTSNIASSLNPNRNFPALEQKRNIFPEKFAQPPPHRTPLCYPSRMSGQTEWPFKDPKNTATFTTVAVIKKHEPICRVCHDDDGAWQFLTGARVTMADAMIVCLSEVVSRDHTLLE